MPCCSATGWSRYVWPPMARVSDSRKRFQPSSSMNSLPNSNALRRPAMAARSTGIALSPLALEQPERADDTRLLLAGFLVLAHHAQAVCVAQVQHSLHQRLVVNAVAHEPVQRLAGGVLEREAVDLVYCAVQLGDVQQRRGLGGLGVALEPLVGAVARPT